MAKKRFHEFQVPLKGVSDYFSYEKQATATTPKAFNVRGHDPRTGRYRGAQRMGLVKYADDRTSNNAVQNINHLITGNLISDAASLDTRNITGIAVTNGTVEKFSSSGFTAVTNGTSAFDNTVPVIFSTLHFGTLYYCDGAVYKTCNGSSVSDWTASAGSLPTDSSNEARLITTWRNRIVMSGISSDPHDWFMSAVDDPTDWDYSPTTTVETQAVAGNNSNAGKCPDLINCLIAYNDDLLIFGGDHSIYQMTGDPMAGGQIDLISDITGMAWGEPYCKSPEGIIYFFGSRGGVYQMAPGSIPERLTSKNISDRLTSVDLSSTVVRLVWSDKEQGFYVFLTELDGSASTHYFYDAREGAWWPDKFDNASMNPTSVHIFDGDAADDRVVLLGCRDGYLRYFSSSALSDDGSPIESEMWLGPLRIDQDMAFIITELQMKLGENSDPVDYELWTGKGAEHAFNNGVCRTKGKWYSGPNRSKRIKSFGHAAYLRLKNFCADEAWSVEEAMIGYSKCGATRQRNRI